MNGSITEQSPQAIASEMNAAFQGSPVRNTPTMRAIRREYTKRLKDADPKLVLAVARELLKYGYRGFPYEIIRYHPATFKSIGEREIEGLGKGIDSWWSVDSLARTLTGPAWLNGQLTDDVIHRWAVSDDLWWRRTALVSTVALNMRSHGGIGDTNRTLEVCEKLVDDHKDMIVKALSWALRELVVHDPQAVEGFLEEHEEVLAARVKREVRNKLMTGLKNPKQRKA